jgi:hypothetical protein
MLPSSAMHGVYDPDTLKAMGAAFDTAVHPHLQDHERARRRLALLIVRRMDSGEPDANLGTVALLDFLRATPGSPSGSPGGTSRGGDTRSSRRARRFGRGAISIGASSGWSPLLRSGTDQTSPCRYIRGNGGGWSVAARMRLARCGAATAEMQNPPG